MNSFVTELVTPVTRNLELFLVVSLSVVGAIILLVIITTVICCRHFGRCGGETELKYEESIHMDDFRNEAFDHVYDEVDTFFDDVPTLSRGPDGVNQNINWVDSNYGFK